MVRDSSSLIGAAARFASGRTGKILLLGAACLLLPWLRAPYQSQLFGLTGPAGLVHLHIGLILAVAMFERDRRVFVGVVVFVYLGGLIKWLPTSAGNPIGENLEFAAFSTLSNVLVALLAWGCARWMGWPRPVQTQRIHQSDLMRFFGIGLVLFPVATAMIPLLLGFTLPSAERYSSAVQILFARHFGVAVITLPLLMLWCEWQLPAPRKLQWRSLVLPAIMCTGLIVGMIARNRVELALSDLAGGRQLELMDYRFVLFVLLGWCALNLRVRVTMTLLMVSMFGLVQLLATTATYNGTPLGFANLLHLAFEMSVLLIGVMYFVVFERDGRELTQRLQAETLRDTATGLPNLKALHEDLKLQPLAAGSNEVGFLLLDQTGDLVTGYGLDMQAQVMNTVAREVASASRPYLIGMGQFALLPNQGEVHPGHCERAMALLEGVRIDSGVGQFGLSPYIGVAHPSSGGPEAVEEALFGASQLAFEARQRHELRPLHERDRIAPASDALRSTLHAASEALLALRAGRIELHFQPIQRMSIAAVPVSGATPAGVDMSSPLTGEVLCRLRDAEGALLPSNESLDAIESVGRSAELDLYVVHALMELLRTHRGVLPGIEWIAVNLSGQSLASHNFRDQFMALMSESPLPMSAFCFEVTETAAINSPAQARELLDQLRARGSRIAIDDFGTGLQSFDRLKQLPFDILKIDGTFVRHVAERGSDYALVEASVSIARAFGAETVAEFVEDQATLDCLRQLGVHWIQGYLVGFPQSLEELLAARASACAVSESSAGPLAVSTSD